MIDNNYLKKAFEKALTPLVRILIKNKISVGELHEWLKSLYANVAKNDFKVEGQKQTNSRISLLTGLPRKSVKEILSEEESFIDDVKYKYNRLTRIIGAWRSDEEFSEEFEPKPLSIHSNDHGSFSALIAKYSGDVPVKVVLNELLLNKSAMINGDKIILNATGYIADEKDVKYNIMGEDVSLLVECFENNIFNSDETWFQKKVQHHSITESVRENFKEFAATKNQELLEEYHQWLLENKGRAKKNENQYAVGVGIYYFQKLKEKE